MIDYLMGYRVRAISSPLKNTDWVWALIFEDDSRIINKDPRIPKPGKELEDAVLSQATTIRRPSGERMAELTFLQPGDRKYEIKLKDYEVEFGSERAFVSQDDPKESLPPDPTPLRVVEGPQ